MNSDSTNNKKIREGFVGQKMHVLPPNVRNVLDRNTLVQNLYLTAIGFYPLASFHDRMRKEGSMEYIFLYCVKGEGEVRINNKSLKVFPNSYILIPPFTPHHYRSSIENPWSIYWIHFKGKSADLLYERYLNGTGLEVKPIPFEEQRSVEFDNMVNLLEDSFSERNLEVVNITLFHFLSSFIYELRSTSTLETEPISRSIEFMKNNINKSMKIQDLASGQNLSVSRFSELFKERTGVSPIKYFIQLKIQKSCQYLYFTDLNIKEICEEVGFEDPFYFSRIFKRMMGIAPSKYRNHYKS